ncbi:hypothetical protein GCM10009665_70500 [Kitasatospora nipponensis]|uniref:Uncharacterized protein n=1 Tax=Kitasatospora nipponensis TaxID=258049 RepID=A0ABN1WYB9_9ACTN
MTVSTAPIRDSGRPVTCRKKTRLNGTYMPDPTESTAMPASRARSPGTRAVAAPARRILRRVENTAASKGPSIVK